MVKINYYIMTYTPFTYLIGWSKLNQYYYGVRYAKGCSPNDLWTRYFTSSNTVREYIKLYGDPDIIQIRKTFNTAEEAILWEHRVLVRMKCKTRSDYLNHHDKMGMPVMEGDNNPSKRPEVRKKLSLIAKQRLPQSKEVLTKAAKARLKRNLIKSLKKSYIFKPSKCTELINRLRKYISLVNDEYPRCKFILNILNSRLDSCVNYVKKPYPKHRKSREITKTPKLSLMRSQARMGMKWYHNVHTLQNKSFRPDDVIPDGWVLGLIKNTPHIIRTVAERQKISENMKQIRALETEEHKQSRLRKYHETIAKRQNQID